MEITKEYIDKFISDYHGTLSHPKIFEQLVLKYEINNDAEIYVVNKLIEDGIAKKIQTEETINLRRMKLDNLKKLVLPEQRTPEWYEMRKDKLTASSLASAIGHCHFKSRDELIYDKIIEAPFEPNPITEWGVKYEDVAIMLYEEL